MFKTSARVGFEFAIQNKLLLSKIKDRGKPYQSDVFKSSKIPLLWIICSMFSFDTMIVCLKICLFVDVIICPAFDVF